MNALIKGVSTFCQFPFFGNPASPTRDTDSMSCCEWHSRYQIAEEDLQTAQAQVTTLQEENRRLQLENVQLSSIAMGLRSERIASYMRSAFATLDSEKSWIEAEKVGLHTGNVLFYAGTLGIGALVEWGLGSTVMGSKFALLEKRESYLTAHRVALTILQRHSLSTYAEIQKVARPLFALYYHQPQGCSNLNKNPVSFQTSSRKYEDLRVLMESTIGPDTEWEEHRGVSVSEYQKKEKESSLWMRRAEGALYVHFQRILNFTIRHPQRDRQVQMYIIGELVASTCTEEKVSLEVLRYYYHLEAEPLKKVARRLFSLYFQAPPPCFTPRTLEEGSTPVVEEDERETKERVFFSSTAGPISFSIPSGIYAYTGPLMTYTVGQESDREQLPNVDVGEYMKMKTETSSRVDAAMRLLLRHHEYIQGIVGSSVNVF